MIRKAILKMYSYIRKLWDKPDLTEIPNDIAKLSIIDFSNLINEYPYICDKLHGLIDNTESISHFLDKSVKSGRDCDDYARMWSAWLVHNGYDAIEVIITNPNRFFTNSHLITIGRKYDKYILLNYQYFGQFSSMESAIEYMKNFNLYKDGYIYTIYRTFNKMN